MNNEGRAALAPDLYYLLDLFDKYRYTIDYDKA